MVVVASVVEGFVVVVSAVVGGAVVGGLVDSVVGLAVVAGVVVVDDDEVVGSAVVLDDTTVVAVDDELGALVDDSAAVLGLSGVVTRSAPSSESRLAPASPLTARKLSVSRLPVVVTSVVATAEPSWLPSMATSSLLSTR